VRAHVEEGIVNYGSGIPPFSGIRGELELAGKDFNLKGMSGRFGASPFTLDGSIADFPLERPTRYLFSMNLQPRQGELAWFLGRGRGDKATLSEGSTLKLSGEGTSALYNLSGDWDLGGAAYSLPDLVAKPSGRGNTLSFRGSFDKEQFRLATSRFTLAPLVLSASAVSRFPPRSGNTSRRGGCRRRCRPRGPGWTPFPGPGTSPSPASPSSPATRSRRSAARTGPCASTATLWRARSFRSSSGAPASPAGGP